MGIGLSRWLSGAALSLSLLTSGCAVHIYPSSMETVQSSPPSVEQYIELHLSPQVSNSDPPILIERTSGPPPEPCAEWVSLTSLPAFSIAPFKQDTSPEALLEAALSRISKVDALLEKGRNNVHCNTATTTASTRRSRLH